MFPEWTEEDHRATAGTLAASSVPPRHSGGRTEERGHSAAPHSARLATSWIDSEALARLNKCSPRTGTVLVAVSLSTESPAPCPVGEAVKMEPTETQAETMRALTEPRSAVETQRMEESFRMADRAAAKR